MYKITSQGCNYQNLVAKYSTNDELVSWWLEERRIERAQVSAPGANDQPPVCLGGSTLALFIQLGQHPWSLSEHLYDDNTITLPISLDHLKSTQLSDVQLLLIFRKITGNQNPNLCAGWPLCQSSRAAVTKCPRLGGVNSRHLLSHSSGG